jgi:hypothetical protein
VCIIIRLGSPFFFYALRLYLLIYLFTYFWVGGYNAWDFDGKSRMR